MCGRSILVLATGVVAASLAACGETEGGSPFDPQRVFEIRERQNSYQDVAFPMDVAQLFRTEAVLPSLGVRSLRLVDGRPFVGTADGLYGLDASGEAFAEISLPGSGPVRDLAPHPDGLLVLRGDSAHVVRPNGEVGASFDVATSSATITALAWADPQIIVGTETGLLAVDGGGSTPIATARAFAVRDLVVIDTTVWIAADQGVLRYDLDGDVLLAGLPELASAVGDDVRALTPTDDGASIWAATAEGLARINTSGNVEETVLPGLGSLPNADVLAIVERGGVVLTGHGIGATAMSAERKDHYSSLRWIPDQRVTAVALGADGTRWIGTPAGISRIYFESTTLAAKAEHNEELLHNRHWRMNGFTAEWARFDDPWDRSGAPTVWDSDNDGQWTETQIGAWCYAYATTGDERYYQAARRAMDTMFLLIDVPGETFEANGMERGFITRSLAREDEGPVFDSKAEQHNWHLQKFGDYEYYWKDDTSADEYDGHYFGIPIFYDLCAKTEEEREEIRKRVRLTTDYLIAGDYLLIDLDGEPTEHGIWRDLAAAVDGVEGCIDERGLEGLEHCTFSGFGGGWLNSLEILSYLLAAWHITGDQKYYDEYERLHTVERYGEMIPVIDDTWTVTRPTFANHSDHEMAMLSYTILLRYEPNPERREIWIRSLLDFYDYEKAERNPFQVATIASAVESSVGLEDGVQTLKELPLDWRRWQVDNSHRLDADRNVADRFGEAQFKTVFPYDEIRSAKWNDSPYTVSAGGDGRAVTIPMPYQIAYWMLRYYGMIRE